MICPTHNLDLIAKPTRFGTRWSCPAFGCTVASWDGSTSTPADAETRHLRKLCHELFDPLWRAPKKKRKFHDRRRAYHWLQVFMGLPPSKAHIGCFDKLQCLRLIGELDPEKGKVKA